MPTPRFDPDYSVNLGASLDPLIARPLFCIPHLPPEQVSVRTASCTTRPDGPREQRSPEGNRGVSYCSIHQIAQVHNLSDCLSDCKKEGKRSGT